MDPVRATASSRVASPPLDASGLSSHLSAGSAAPGGEKTKPGPVASDANRLTLQGRTTASEGHSCERCQKPLSGRKERFCSDACRMAARRQLRALRVQQLLAELEAAVDGLRVELEGHHEPA
jgi:predicted nucleic acid-binding Zn ribbon protein